MNFKNMAAIVLAAGKGTRINAKEINKVMYPLAGKPMLWYTINLLKKVGFSKIIIVVGFLKESIINYFGRKDFIYAEQRKRLGTAHAVKTGLKKIPSGIKNVLVLHADDSAFYPVKVIRNMINQHLRKGNDLSFLTVEIKNPNIARVIRDKKGKVLGIVEQQNLKPGQEKFKEINCGCYCFKIEFLKKFLPQIKKNSLTKEYYLPLLIDLGIQNKAKVRAFKMNKSDYWHGINTRGELQRAEGVMRKNV